MPTFESAEALVHWITRQGGYDLLPLADEDPLLVKIQRIEREGQLRMPGFVLIALRKRQDEGEEPEDAEAPGSVLRGS